MNKGKTSLRMAASVAVLALSTALAGCISPSAGSKTGLYAKPIGNAPVTSNPTPYTAALICLGDQARAQGRGAPRIAVGRIIDYTGKVDAEGGRKITQGASLMAITAFSKTGARLVERFDTSVSELELKYANNKLISDTQAAPDADVRKIIAGQVPGSDFYLVGGITEMNYNIRSSGVDGFFGQTDARDTKGNLNAKLFVMNIGIDLRLVDTKTLEVVDVISYQKQIIGRELRAGVFSFWDDTLIDIGAGERALEPIQLAVRGSIERAVLEMMSTLYRIDAGQTCARQIAEGGDPMGMGSRNKTGDFRTMIGPEAAVAADRRADPNAGHDKRDPAVKAVDKEPRREAAVTPAAAPAPIAAVQVRPAPRPVAAPVAQPVYRPAGAQPAPVPVRTLRTTTQPRPVDGLRPTTGN